MKKILLLGALACIALPAYGEKKIQLTPNVDDSIPLELNEQYTFERPVSGSIGYTWIVKTNTPKSIVKINEATTQTGRAIGAPGIKTFTITPIKPGTAVITFVKMYRGEETEQYVLEIKVKAAQDKKNLPS